MRGSLKEFEKWWKKDSWEGDWDYEEYAKRGWDASLEWVMRRGMHHYGNDFLTDMTNLSREIREELED